MRSSNNLGKKDSLRHISKSSAGMDESSGSQFFRSTIRIHSRPRTFGESRSSEIETLTVAHSQTC